MGLTYISTEANNLQIREEEKRFIFYIKMCRLTCQSENLF